MRPEQPIFDIQDHFDTTISIGDKQLPIHVKRYSRAEMEAFEKKWAQYVLPQRGASAIEALRTRLARAPKDGLVVLTVVDAEAILAYQPTPADAAAADAANAEILRFIEDTIVDAITVDPGYVRDRGADVTDGRGLIGVFHARKDVLAALLAAVATENRLTAIVRKNSNSPRDSSTGSMGLAPTSGERATGAEPDSTAARVDAPGSVSDGAATANDETGAASPSSSGATPKVH